MLTISLKKKHKPYPENQDSGVEWLGQIPRGWQAEKLKWITRFSYGESLAELERQEGSISVYGSNGIVGYHNRAITKGQTIIVGRKGSAGKVQFADSDCFPIDTTFYIDRTQTKKNLRWLYYLLSILGLDENNQDSAVPGLSRENAYQKNVPICSKEDQQKIAAFLDEKTALIEKIIEKKQRLIELLREKRAAFINKSVTKGLDDTVEFINSGIEWLGKIPEGWQVEPLKYQSAYLSRGESPDYTEESRVKIINQACIYWENIKFKNVKYNIQRDISKSKGRIYKGDLLMNSTGTGTLGRISYFNVDDNCEYLADSHVTIIRTKHNLLHPQFLKYQFGTELYQGYIYASAVSGSTNQIELSREKLRIVPVILPLIKDQQKIAAFLDEKTALIDDAIQKIQRSIDLLQEFKASLISNVVTGKVKITHVNLN